MNSLLTRLRFYISPLFLVRYYNLKCVKETVDKYKFKGKVLDFGCGDKPYKYIFTFGTDYKGIDFRKYSTNNCFSHTEPPDYYFDNDYKKTFRIPFDNEKFNHVVAFQVLEHHQSPEKMISEIFRVVKRGGYVLMTVPFIGGIHGEPDDYQRFTKYGLKVLVKKYGAVVMIKEQGSVFSVISTLFGESLIGFTGKSKACYFVGMIMFPPFLLYSYLALILDKIFRSDHIFINYLILIKKHSIR